MDDDDDDNVGLPEDYDDNAGPEDSQLVDAEVNAEVDATNPVDEEVVPSSGKKAAKGRGRPKTRSSDASQTAEGQQEAEADAEVEEAPFKKSRGRPAKAGKPAALAAKDKNQPPKAAKKTKAAKDEDKKDATQGGPRQRIRHQTPADAVEMGHTRAGRHVYKPLDYWKGERAEFRVGDTHDEFELAELILVDDATPIKRPHRRVGKTKASKKRKYNVYEEDIEDNELEPWETSDGVIRAPVQLWDAEQGVNTADEEEQGGYIIMHKVPSSLLTCHSRRLLFDSHTATCCPRQSELPLRETAIYSLLRQWHDRATTQWQQRHQELKDLPLFVLCRVGQGRCGG